MENEPLNLDPQENQKKNNLSVLKNSFDISGVDIPQIQENPVLTKIRTLLDSCEASILSEDIRAAIGFYNDAKNLYESNEIPDNKIINRFYELSFKLDVK